MKILLLLLISLNAFAITGSEGLPLPAAVEAQLNTSAVHAPEVGLGTQVTQKKVNVMKAVYDFAKLGGSSGASVILKDAAGGQAVLPKKAIIVDCIIDVITNLTSSGTPTVSVGVTTATDILGATTYSSITQRKACVPVGTAATSVKVGGAKAAVTATINTNDLTAGKFNVFLYYLLSD